MLESSTGLQTQLVQSFSSLNREVASRSTRQLRRSSKFLLSTKFQQAGMDDVSRSHRDNLLQLTFTNLSR